VEEQFTQAFNLSKTDAAQSAALQSNKFWFVLRHLLSFAPLLKIPRAQRRRQLEKQIDFSI
jgi:hypothetical protein